MNSYLDEAVPVQPDPKKLRFVQVKFGDRMNSKVYTYRIEPDASVRPGQYGITRKNMSKVTIIAIDTEPVPNLDISKYDFVDPVEPLEGEDHGDSHS